MVTIKTWDTYRGRHTYVLRYDETDVERVNGIRWLPIHTHIVLLMTMVDAVAESAIYDTICRTSIRRDTCAVAVSTATLCVPLDADVSW